MTQTNVVEVEEVLWQWLKRGVSGVSEVRGPSYDEWVGSTQYSDRRAGEFGPGHKNCG